MNTVTKSNINCGNFSTVIAPLLEAGMGAEHVLPLVPPDAELSPNSSLGPKDMGKAPGRWNPRTGLWSGLTGQHLASPLSAEFVEECRAYPTHNVGVRGAAYPAIDADVASPAAARAADRAMVNVFGFAGGKRGREGSPRALYPFCGDIASRPKWIEFRMRGDTETSFVEVIAQGKQWVAAGIHPSGSTYVWDQNADLADLLRRGVLDTLTNADLDRFQAELTRIVEEDGGEIIRQQDGRGGGSSGGKARDTSNDEPTMPVDVLFRGLERLRNTEVRYPTRESFVGVLGSIRAALGHEASAHEDDVRRWAVETSDGWCDEDYFDGVWQSLDQGVKVSADALEAKFRSVGFLEPLFLAFPADKIAAEAEAFNREWVKSKAHQRRCLLSSVSNEFRFCEANTADGEQYTQIRPRERIRKQRRAIDWFNGKTLFSPKSRLDKLREVFGTGDEGLNNLLQALEASHPECFFENTVKYPLYDIGEMIERKDAQGNIFYELNERPLPLAQKLGAKMPNGSGDPRVNADVATFLDFVGRAFGRHVDYELNCLAHMAQTGQRPGNVLFFMGDGHTGKTMYADGLSLMFDGASHTIAGAKLKDSLKFALPPLEGARIGQIIELPATLGADTRASLDSLVKITVDASRRDSTIPIEEKGKAIREVPNYVRLVVTSNFQSGLYIGEQDRRVFYILNGINGQNSPPRAWWDIIDAILKDERRLASVWRYLLDRDTTGYDRTAAPPLTLEKMEAQRASLDNPVQRHARDAVSALVAARRVLVDAKEVASLMTAMAHNEWQNSGRKTDDRPQDGYSFAARGPGVHLMLGELSKAFSKLADFKSGGTRLPTIYVRKGAPEEQGLADAPRVAVLDRLAEDRGRNPILEDHMGEAVRGPATPPSTAANDFR